jgi:hypothetical protein
VGSSLENVWCEPISGAILHELMTPDPDWEEVLLAWYDAFRTEAFRTAHAELSESLKELGGAWGTNRAAYRQTFSNGRAFEDHSGPKPRA